MKLFSGKSNRNVVILAVYALMLILAWFGADHFLFSQGPASNLVDQYQARIESDPDDAVAHYNLGEVYLELNEQMPSGGYLARAREQFQQAVNLVPEQIEYRYALASLLQTSNKQAALQQYKAILEVDPYEVQANYEVALDEMASGNIDASIVHFEKCLVREPTSADVFFKLGELFERQKKTDEALRMYMMAQEYDPALKSLDEKLSKLSNKK